MMTDDNVPAVAPEKSRLPILAGAIGLLVFVLSIAVFSITMGVFSTSNVVTTSPQADADAGGQNAEGMVEDEFDDFHSSYYEDLYRDDDSPEAADSGVMTEEDSLQQLSWYEKQKKEIESERRRIEIEKADLDKLKHETMNLIDQRRSIEDANIVQMAKLFDSMKAPEIAAIMENMTDEQVGVILMKMKKQNASKVLAELPAERAAKITTQMMNLAEGT